MESISKVLGPVEIFFTLFKGMVGIGFLYLPIGYSHAGWAFSVVAFLVCTVFSSEGFNRLVASHEKAGGTYSELAKKAGGRGLKIVVEVFLVISQVRYWVRVVDVYGGVCSFYNSELEPDNAGV